MLENIDPKIPALICPALNLTGEQMNRAMTDLVNEHKDVFTSIIFMSRRHGEQGVEDARDYLLQSDYESAHIVAQFWPELYQACRELCKHKWGMSISQAVQVVMNQHIYAKSAEQQLEQVDDDVKKSISMVK